MPGDVAFAKPQEKGTEKSWRQQRVGGEGGGGGWGGTSEKQAVCVSLCWGQGHNPQEGVHPEGK